MDDKEIINRITALEKWRADREKQQITLPLDPISQTILQNYFPRIISSVVTVGGVTGQPFTTYIARQGNFVFEVPQSTLVNYTVDVSANTLNVVTSRFDNDRLVSVATENTTPNPLSTSNSYYVVNASNGGLTFKLSLTLGGAAIDITTSGTGKQYVSYLYT